MNPGYLSLVIALMALILLASGWKDTLLKGLSYKAVYLFYLCWIVSFFIHLQIGTVTVNGVYLVFVLLALIGLYGMKRPLERLQAVSLSVLLGCTMFMIVELTFVSPALTVKYPVFHSLFVLMLLSIVMQRKALHQVTLITAALLISDTLQHVSRSGFPLMLGEPEMQDKWWQSAAGARLGTVFLEAGWSVIRSSFSLRKSVRRKDGEDS